MEGVSKLFRKSAKRAKPSSALPEGLCRQFSLAEIKIATNNFNDELLVGEGGFGRVYKGFIDDCNKTVAIKRLKLKPGQGLVFEDLRTKVVLLCQLRHPNLVPLIGYCIDEGENILVYEFIVNGNLFRKLYYTDHDEHDRLSWKQRLRICIGVVRALHYLHTGVKHTIIHGDMKPANILLNKKWEAKLSDFSRFVSDSTMLDTLGYVDPECRITSGLTDKSDVYSFGVVLFKVVLGKMHQWRLISLAQKGEREWSFNKKIDPYLKGKIAPECFKVYMDIATSCVQHEGKDRPTMNEVEVGLEHALELQESADAAIKDGEYYCPIDEYTCNDFWGFASPAIVEYTSSSSLPELEEFLSDSDSLREYI
ncbi:receptor-like protein kinase FERONIA [Quercus lobata]|uniref:Protein kinase domain-containing protein n=1 Tax=Quercus lobata TaxID=97700 RepID=A0A7N2N6V1_QUELO|nr:receptor-like protein kinase FERONIA [Quercus lobata]